MGLEDVDYDRPPRGGLFDDFQMNRTREVRAATPAVTPAVNLYNNANNAFVAMTMAGLAQLQFPGGSMHLPLASKDVAEGRGDASCITASSSTSIEYPMIDSFLRELMDKHPNRNFEGLAENMLAQDFFCIDELQHKGEAFFQEEPYALSQGNAKFIVQKLQKAVRRAKAAAK